MPEDHAPEPQAEPQHRTFPGHVELINGKQRRFTGYQDTVNLPAATRKNGRLVPGEVTVIIPFTNPLMVGQFVYYCHIVQHADQGMMANI